MSGHEKVCLLMITASGAIASLLGVSGSYSAAAVWVLYAVVWAWAFRLARDVARTKREVMEMRRRPRGL